MDPALRAAAALLALSAPFASAQPAEPAASLPAFSPEDMQVMAEFVRALRPDVVAQLGEGEEALPATVGQLGPFLAREQTRALLPRWLRWAKSDLAGPTGWVNDCSATLLVLGPPGGIHREPNRAWEGGEAQTAASPWDSMLQLAGLPPRSETEPFELDFEMATEFWVYPQADGSLVVLTFGDSDGDGVMRFLRRQDSPAGTQVSSAPMVAVPASLFGSEEGQVEVLEGVPELPALEEDPVAVRVLTSFFKATEGRTAVRFAVAVDPTDVELELDVDDAAAYLGKSLIWLRVERDGQPVFQDAFEPTKGALTRLGTGYLDELVAVPLAPGIYRATVLLADQSRRGGVVSTSVQVPDLRSSPALSSLILTRAEGGTVPKASAGVAPTAAGEEPEFEAFRVGSYLVRPHVSAEFRAGETLGLAVQVYGSGSVTLEYDLYFSGRLANQLDPVNLSGLPATDIQLIDVLDVWPAGTYKFVVTAESRGQKVGSREVTFRVRK